jgi:hypothetical protein
VYAGVDVLSGRPLYLKQAIPACPAAWREAERARDELVRQVEENRQPKTNASGQYREPPHVDLPRYREELWAAGSVADVC